MVEPSFASGMLMLVCPDSGAEIATHALYSATDFQRAGEAKLLLYCPSCKKEHVFKFADGRLDPVRANGG